MSSEGAAILRALLAYILARGAAHKVRERSQFVAQLQAYRLLPASLLTSMAMVLAIAEACAAITLLKLDWQWPAIGAAALFAIYGVAMAINLARGRRDLSCGCGGPLAAAATIDWILVARNAALTAVALLVSFVPSAALAPIDFAIICAGAAALLLLYEAAEQAVANRQRVRSWKEARSWTR